MEAVETSKTRGVDKIEEEGGGGRQKKGTELSAGNNSKGPKSAARVIDKQEHQLLLFVCDPNGMIISRRSIKLIN